MGKSGEISNIFCNFAAEFEKRGDLYERQHRQLAQQSKAPQKVTNFFGDPALPAAPKREKQQEKNNILK